MKEKIRKSYVKENGNFERSPSSWFRISAVPTPLLLPKYFNFTPLKIRTSFQNLHANLESSAAKARAVSSAIGPGRPLTITRGASAPPAASAARGRGPALALTHGGQLSHSKCAAA